MYQNEITKLALKLMGIYILVQAMIYLPTVVGVLSTITQTPNETKAVSITLLATVTALLIFGSWLTFKNKPKLDTLKGSEINLLEIGLTIAGIIIFAFAISDLPFFITKFVYTYTSQNAITIIGADSNLENIMKLLGNLIQLLLGGALFFKAKDFAKLIK